ncbi:MAG: DUF5674 family protein [bacterium]
MEIIKDHIALSKLREMSKAGFGNMVKAVVDINREIMAVDAELHADEESLLIENGSAQEYLWGINIYPDLAGDERIEFDSMINLRPAQGNPTRNVENDAIRNQITGIVNRLISP